MWIPIDEIASEPTERFGFKASRLAEARERAIEIPESFVLECDELARVREDPAHAESWAQELLSVLPVEGRVLLRSSSPLEDRPDASAAGLLPSLARAARVDAIADGLREMAAAMEEPSLRALMGTGEDPVPLAVLAQPRLELELWCTLEWDGDRGLARIEGRQLDSCGDHAFHHEAIPLDASDTLSESGVGVGALMALARRAQEHSEGVWLLELGVSDDQVLLLQRRPVMEAAPAGPELEWSGFPVFESDRRADWEWDAAHSPRPLAPLLASLFVEWIRERGESHPSRIIDGRWHDRRSESSGGSSGDLREALRAWYGERIPALEQDLELVEMLASDCREYASWRLFVVAWLDWQTKYYDGAAGALRRLAAGFVDAGGALELPPTLTSQRERELDSLAAQWDAWDEDQRGEALGEFLDDHGYHGPGHWDGYTVPWDQDPTPLLREIERRAAAGPPAAADPAPDAAPGEGRGLPPDDAADEHWAARALAALEDDDDLLAYAYALFRDAALNLEEELQPEAGDGEILEILDHELAEFGAPVDPELWRAARARGARLLARWEQAAPDPGAPAAPGETLHGHPALSAGNARGRVRILDTALRDGGPEHGEILVVPTVMPGDALVFSRCAGLICESGEVLGHAAVLAREHRIPALVLPQACSRLRDAECVELDADGGTVHVVEGEA